MSEPVVVRGDERLARGPSEPLAALLVGGVAAILVFELCALFFGNVTGVAIAVVAALAALMRRAYPSLVLFIAAACICALFAREVQIAAALLFGAGLALLARAATSRVTSG